MYSLLLLGLCSFVLALLLTPACRMLSVRARVLDRPDHGRKSHVSAVPRTGGVAVLLAYCGAFAAPIALRLNAVETLESGYRQVAQLGPAILLVFLTGLLDDIVGLKPWQKLVGQLTAAVLACSAGLNFSFRGLVFESWWHIPVTLAWLVFCTNALNLIDGVDGLAAGVGLCAALTMILSALLEGNTALAMLAVPLAGALLGFLRYNFTPASIFMGDCGSLTIGFLLGCYGIIWSHKTTTVLGLTVPLMALAVPLLDAAVAIVRRLLRGQPIFSADRRHIHHRLLDRGLTVRRVVLLLYGACGLAAAFSLLQSVAPKSYSGLIIVLFGAAVWTGVQHLNYPEFAVAGRMILSGTLLRALNFQVRLGALEETLARAETLEHCWYALREAGRELGFNRLTLEFQGRRYEFALRPMGGGGQWFLRIPLSRDCEITLGREFATGAADMTIAGQLAGVLRRALQPKLGVARRPVRNELQSTVPQAGPEPARVL